MSTDVVLSKIDQTILRYCDSESAEEISRRLGGVITPERVAAQKTVLLTSKRWVDAAEQDELVLYRLRNILAQLEEKYLDLDNALVQLRFLKEIGARLDKRREATKIDLETYDLNVARVLGQVVDQSLSYMKGALRSEVDPDLWDQLVIEAMRHAQTVIEQKAVED
ncbi:MULTISPECIES: hypothetical protein [unclassified Microbacterium]|uniref:hypothetical protein n=1 Tax=unclassified Microbacterium TaxID=2609290 RepID=UPI000EA869FA|nr:MULTISPECIES: hypothetical protein [unclassified Microbacterium]MBT2484758.1 hypothetical protein [Microbacterium sp. ISL-108]RKN67635.1 hypothetical protein D7252_08605 [Microbacterium sp. CGR2]